MGDTIDDILKEMTLVFGAPQEALLRQRIIEVLSYMQLQGGCDDRLSELHGEYRRMIERLNRLATGTGERQARAELEILAHAADILPKYSSAIEAFDRAKDIDKPTETYVGPVRKMYRACVAKMLRNS